MATFIAPQALIIVEWLVNWKHVTESQCLSIGYRDCEISYLHFDMNLFSILGWLFQEICSVTMLLSTFLAAILLCFHGVSCISIKIEEFDDLKCDSQLEHFKKALLDRNWWALNCEFTGCWPIIFFLINLSPSVFDSWTKFQSGISFGNLVDFGSFEQCLEFQATFNVSSFGTIQGQHCLVFYEATPASEIPPQEGMDWSEMWVEQRSRCKSS